MIGSEPDPKWGKQVRKNLDQRLSLPIDLYASGQDTTVEATNRSDLPVPVGDQQIRPVQRTLNLLYLPASAGSTS